MKVFYAVEDGKIRVCESGDDETPVPVGFKETDNKDLYKNEGDPVEWFDDNMRRIPDENLVRQGIRVDKRGLWYNKITGEKKYIHNLDVSIDETLYTKAAPIKNESYQKFENNEWIIDTEKKDKAEKESRLSVLISEIEDAERRQIRPLKAIINNEATSDDTDTYNRYEAIILQLRSQITELEQDLL